MVNKSPAITDLSLTQIEYYMDRYEHFHDLGDAELAEFFRGQAETLGHTMDSGSEILTLTYHRWLSDSYGVVFEQDHGDEELMFGGID